ncbi:MAG: glycerophosphodiester phosphodiesterase family protein [bacterium]|nr:glycerophosphodiester phosphodiesterase family protein [bacterium]
MNPRPLIFGHRGDSAHATENTLQAIRMALDKGADGVEVDAWRCGSGEIVIFHDHHLKRLTGQEGDIRKMPYSEISQFPLPCGEKIPLLEEVLECMGPHHWVNVELKGGKFPHAHLEKEVYLQLKGRNMLQRSIISSFHPLSLFRLGRLHPRPLIGLIFKGKSFLPLRKRWAAPFLSLTHLHGAVSELNPRLMERARRRNQKVIAWTVNNIHDLETCLKLGVHGMISDDPGWLITELERM